MSSAIDGIERLIGRLYTAFVLRDLTFFISGAIVISIVVDRPIDVFSKLLSSDTELWWFGLIIFLSLSYVLGVILQEAARLIFLERLAEWWIERETGRSGKRKELVVRIELISEISDHTLYGIERVLFLKQIAATQFSAVTIAMLFYVFRNSGSTSPWIITLFISIIFLCSWMYIEKARQQDDILYDLELGRAKETEKSENDNAA